MVATGQTLWYVNTHHFNRNLRLHNPDSKKKSGHFVKKKNTRIFLSGTKARILVEQE